jgi:hypothetical protein
LRLILTNICFFIELRVFGKWIYDYLWYVVYGIVGFWFRGFVVYGFVVHGFVVCVFWRGLCVLVRFVGAQCIAPLQTAPKHVQIKPHQNTFKSNRKNTFKPNHKNTFKSNRFHHLNKPQIILLGIIFLLPSLQSLLSLSKII